MVSLAKHKSSDLSVAQDVCFLLYLTCTPKSQLFELIIFFIIIPTINPVVILSEFTVVSNLKPFCPWGGGGGGKDYLRVTPYNSIYREALPERGTFFRLQVYERVGISQVEVYKRVVKSVVWVCKRAQKG